MDIPKEPDVAHVKTTMMHVQQLRLRRTLDRKPWFHFWWPSCLFFMSCCNLTCSQTNWSCDFTEQMPLYFLHDCKFGTLSWIVIPSIICNIISISHIVSYLATKFKLCSYSQFFTSFWCNHHPRNLLLLISHFKPWYDGPAVCWD